MNLYAEREAPNQASFSKRSKIARLLDEEISRSRRKEMEAWEE